MICDVVNPAALSALVMSGASNSTYRVELTVSGRIAATLPLPDCANGLSVLMTAKLFVNDFVDRLLGPVAAVTVETLVTIVHMSKMTASPPMLPLRIIRTALPPIWASGPSPCITSAPSGPHQIRFEPDGSDDSQFVTVMCRTFPKDEDCLPVRLRFSVALQFPLQKSVVTSACRDGRS